METKDFKILLVDDDPVMLDLHSAYLENQGHEILAANNGVEALALVKNEAETIGVIISDVSMPEMDGYELCQKIKDDSATSHLPVIFVSALSTLDEKLRGYAVGADDYIIKPVEEKELIEKARALIERQGEIANYNASVTESRNIAIQAVSFSNELGQVIEFYNRMLSSKDYVESANHLFEMAEKYELICTLQIHTPDKTLNLSNSGNVSPLEANVIELARNKERFFDFGERTIINYHDFSLLIKNMPVFDHERYARIKDIFAMVANGLEAKIKQLNDKTLSERKESVIKSIQDSLSNIEQSFDSIQKENVTSIEDMNDDIKKAIMVLGLMEDQEDDIQKIVKRCLKKINNSFYKALNIREDLTNINKQFHMVLGANS